MDKVDSSSPSAFQCCICLDLLYKPVVLACGHISCFWCVHKAMHGLRASHCPLCRQLYIYFPGICELMHRLLLKLEPEAYKIRETEVFEEEKRLDVFSPQLGNSAIPSSHLDTEICSDDVPEKPSPPKNIVENGNEITISDVLCELCKELLYQPGVLNCGHVFCESCLCGLPNEPLTCPVCQSVHPGEFPNICLDFDHFLQEKFPGEYAKRKGTSVIKRKECQHGESSSSGLHEKENGGQKSVKNDARFLWEEGNLQDVNCGVGCDSCGMYPIIGKRYKCKDCKEEIGFDLCESCYNSSSKLPGRFNQQHRPDHKFEFDDSHMLSKILFRSLAVEDGRNGTIIYYPEDSPDDIPSDIQDATSDHIPDDDPNHALESNDDFNTENL